MATDPPVPVKIRTARKQHACDDCGQPVKPGDRYELCVLPPHRSDVVGNDRWLTWRSHYPRSRGPVVDLMGCAEAAAYDEKQRRETADA